MRRKYLMIVLTFVLLAATGRYSQAQDTPAIKMPPAAQVVSMGLDKFVKSCEKQTPLSEGDYDQVYSYYYECKRHSDDIQARHLPAARRQQINTIRTKLTDVENNYIDLSSAVAGGGTMYRHLKNRVYGDREEFIGSLITTLHQPAPQHATTRQRVNATLARIKTRLNQLATPPKDTLDGYDATERAQAIKEYRSAYDNLKQAATGLQAIIKAMPDTAAWSVVRYLDRVMVYPLQ